MTQQRHLTVNMKRNDLLPNLVILVTYGNGEPVDLSAATNPKFFMRSCSAAADADPKIDKVATVSDGTGGEMTYLWSGTDTDTAGTYHAEFECQIGGKRLTFPNNGARLTVIVHPDIE